MTEPIQSIPFDRATLCEDCNMVTESVGVACVVCGGLALVNLRRLVEKLDIEGDQRV